MFKVKSKKTCFKINAITEVYYLYITKLDSL